MQAGARLIPFLSRPFGLKDSAAPQVSWSPRSFANLQAKKRDVWGVRPAHFVKGGGEENHRFLSRTEHSADSLKRGIRS